MRIDLIIAFAIEYADGSLLPAGAYADDLNVCRRWTIEPIRGGKFGFVNLDTIVIDTAAADAVALCAFNLARERISTIEATPRRLDGKPLVIAPGDLIVSIEADAIKAAAPTPVPADAPAVQLFADQPMMTTPRPASIPPAAMPARRKRASTRPADGAI